MASDLNRVVIIGRLARDPELKHTPNGTAVAGFSVASNYSFGSGDNKKEQVSYFDCIAWSKTGEIITEYVKKGHRIAIEGRLQQRRWDDQDGNKKSKIEIVVENFQFLEGKKEAETPQSKPAAKKPEPKWDDANPFNDDDIPF